jgi:hypothetical protein
VYSFTTLTIGSGLHDISEFSGSCGWYPEITAINISPNHPHYSSVDGVLFNKNRTVLILYPKKKQGTSYTVPNSVTEIQSLSFAGNWMFSFAPTAA